MQYIITGNLLKGYTNFRKTKGRSVRKGKEVISMPDHSDFKVLTQ